MNELGNQVFSLIGQILFIEISNTSNREQIKYIIEVSVIWVDLKDLVFKLIQH